MTPDELRMGICQAERTQLKGGKLLAEVLSPVEIEQIAHNVLAGAETVRRNAVDVEFDDAPFHRAGRH